MTVANGQTGTITKPSKVAAPVRWNPLSELNEMQRRMDDLFGRSIGLTPGSLMLPTETFQEGPNVDIYETPDHFEVFAAVPGFAANEITVEATADTVTIRGKRDQLYEGEPKTHRHGRVACADTFEVYYTLPTEIDPNKIAAQIKNGVLKLIVPKTEPARTAAVKVSVNPG